MAAVDQTTSDARRTPLSLTLSREDFFVAVKTIWAHLTPRRRRQLALLSVLVVLSTFAEMVSIAAIFPFLAVLTAPDQLFEHEFSSQVLEYMGISGPEALLLPMTMFFIGIVVASGLLRLTLSWAQAKLAHLIGIDLAVDIFDRVLHQPYSEHAAKNTSRALTVITGKTTRVATGLLLPTLQILSAGALFLFVSSIVLAVAPVLALSLIGGFALLYGSIALLLQRRIRQNGQLISLEMPVSLQLLQEGLGGIRDVILDNAQRLHVSRFKRSVTPARLAAAQNTYLSMAPRFIIETIGLVLIAAFAFRLAGNASVLDEALPMLGAIALGAQRLLPVAQQAYAAWTNIRGAGAAVAECLDYLDLPLPAATEEAPATLLFQREIRFSNVSFSYDDKQDDVLRDINLVIPRGARVGIIGKTGSGKSTLVDILMGLLSPKTGELRVDGQVIDCSRTLSWQRHIAHVPQAIFLADSTLAENVAFGVAREKIDRDRVRDALDRAQLTNTVERLPNGIDTLIGERGGRLSGGQRQRVGIARALYRKADVIILDEATSALDTQTEAKVMDAINQLDDGLTVIMIAHRLSTLEKCDMIIELEDGRIVQTG